MSVICSSRNSEIFHRYKGIGGIKRYVSRMKLTHDWHVQPYMVCLYRNKDQSGQLVITFMNKRRAECSFASYAKMAILVRRWRNLRHCSISESYEINHDEMGATGFTIHPSTKAYRLERIWEVES